MPGKRKSIPRKIKQKLQEEAGFRCAVPNCRATHALQYAHINPVAEDGSNLPSNMILLCAICHKRFDDHDPHLTREALINIKRNLIVAGGLYNSFEMRVLEYFMDNPQETSVSLVGREFDVMYLIKDGLLTWDGKKMVNAVNLPPKTYLLTAAGKQFIEDWKAAKSLELGLKTKKAAR